MITKEKQYEVALILAAAGLERANDNLASANDDLASALETINTSIATMERQKNRIGELEAMLDEAIENTAMEFFYGNYDEAEDFLLPSIRRSAHALNKEKQSH